MDSAAFLETLAQALGRPVTHDGDDRTALFAQDIFAERAPVEAVVAPRSTAEVSAVIVCARDHGRHVIARGGGASYTSGYLSDVQERSVLLDMSGMDRVLEVNAEDMYVLVEPGCTWAALDAQLAPSGVRARYWGPMSGLRATVGGSVGQNAIFWGSGEAGSTADTVLGVEVVTGEGVVLRTGSLGVAGCSPFFRHFGPDLTGLFTADAGVHGIKTRIALALAPRAAVTDAIAFGLADHRQLCGLLSDVARAGLAAQTMGLDGGMRDARMQREGWRADIGHLLNLFRGGNPLKAIRHAAGIVRAGRGFLDGHSFSAHIFLESDDARGMAAKKARVRAMAAHFDAVEVAPSIGRAMLANPFPPLGGIQGPAGERWVPVHCILPHSRAVAGFDAIKDVLAAHHAVMEQHAISSGTLFSTIGRNGFVIEPMFLWPDVFGALHRDLLGERRMGRFPARPENKAARAAVADIRKAIGKATDALGAVHLQIGRHYPHSSRLSPDTAAFAARLRASLDGGGVINPGALP